MSTSMIEIDNVSFSFGEIPVLRDVSLNVEAGEFIGLVGPNGGGKSTLVRLIAGLIEPDIGKVKVLGKAPRHSRSAIGYVPQYPAFARDFPITVE
ncbi:ATP-binding cassette domain-containing protein, partial [Solemya elarraichensis gill symbiont]